jgi:Raf kinase inhibitor-like YbhB/YbcL family protein
MRMPARTTLAALVAILVALVAAPAAIAKLQLRVLGLQPGHRFGISQVYNSFGCTGRNLSPALRISGVPAHTQSLAITIHDPDAATQSGWWHWLLYDLPATTRRLAEGAGSSKGTLLPAGARQGPNDFGALDYGGVCPPAGDHQHRYHVTLWALKVSTLAVPPGASAALIDYMIEANALAHRTVVVRYSR